METTVMVRNLPLSFTRPELEEVLNDEGFREQYNFIYLPAKLTTGAAFGYAFVNFVTAEEATRFLKTFHGYDRWSVPAAGRAVTHISQELQGLEANINRYRNSSLMHASVPDWVRPALYRSGERIPFAPPTVELRPPRMRGSLAALQDRQGRQSKSAACRK